MTWFRLQEEGAFHPKVVRAGNEAYGAWCRAGQWSSQYLTDGVVPLETALLIGPLRLWKKLEQVGLVERREGEAPVTVHDFLDFNPNAVEVRAERARKAKNIQDFRSRRRVKPKSHVTANETAPVTEGVTGYFPGVKPGLKPACNRGPDPDPDPRSQTTAAARAREDTKPVDAIARALVGWPSCRSLPVAEVAEMLAIRFASIEISKGTKLEWFIEALGQAACDGSIGLSPEALTKKLRVYGDRARPPTREIAPNGHSEQSAVIDTKEPTAAEAEEIRRRAEAKVARQNERKVVLEQGKAKA